jgi:hypothetical protein
VKELDNAIRSKEAALVNLNDNIEYTKGILTSMRNSIQKEIETARIDAEKKLRNYREICETELMKLREEGKSALRITRENEEKDIKDLSLTALKRFALVADQCRKDVGDTGNSTKELIEKLREEVEHWSQARA